MGKADEVRKFIFEEISEGRLKTGQRLPSCRNVASLLSINKITVNKVYHELEQEHKVYSIPRGGFYLVVTEENKRTAQEIVDFRTVRPEDRLIPYREFSHVMNIAIDRYKNSLFGYETTSGLPSLRNTLKLEFEKDGVYTAAEKIIITNGAQQAIWLVLQSLFRTSDLDCQSILYRDCKGKLLVEVPTYNLVLKLADYLRIEVIGIERRLDGFDYKEMEKIFMSGDIKAFYIMPRHHNPTGYTLTEKEKQRIAELACKYNIQIIEDDYLADLGSRKGYLPIHYYDISKRTIYIRSFSKTFMPGIRLGCAVLPETMVADITYLKQISDLNTSKLPQAALDNFIKSGMYEKQVIKVRQSYENKLRKAAEICKSFIQEGFQIHVPEHGIFLWLQLPSQIKAEELEKKLEESGIYIKAATEFFPIKWLEESKLRNCNYIRICISGVSEEQMDALATVITAIK